MKDRGYKFLIFVFYTVSLFILLFFIKVRLTPNVYLKTGVKIILLFIICLLIYFSSYILVKKLNYDKKILKINLIIYFLIYIITIFNLTLFDEIYGRQGFNIVKWNKELFDMYINTSFNIIPFDTIKLFINGYINDLVTLKDFFTNVFGNLCAFMPFSIFIPLIFKRINKYYKFLIVMTIIIIVIELLQFITMSGACDIDDLILNLLGVSIMYFIIKIKIVNKYINKLFLFE